MPSPHHPAAEFHYKAAHAHEAAAFLDALPHGFVNLQQSDAVQVLVSTPARHDEFFRAMAALPANYDPSEFEAVCRKFNQKILGTVQNG